MIPVPLEELVDLALGRLQAAPGAGTITGVQIDSRRVGPGDLFVAVGRGSAFTHDALDRGAAAVLVPDDAFGAMAALGRAVRRRSGARVTAVTGSTGKTSTKDILAALCRPHARVVSAEASFNNELGVPLTLCRIESDTEIVVLELAMRGFGQIAHLASFAEPHVGVITNVAPVHLELVGSVEGVARAKAELIAALQPGGTAVVPANAALLAPYVSRRSDLRVVRFGDGGDVSLRALEVGDSKAILEIDASGRTLRLEFAFTARYQACNALAAVGAYLSLGLPAAEVAAGAAGLRLERWRGEERPLDGGGILINDAYNANPVSMRAALEHLAERAGAGRRRVAVLGDMAELGAGAVAFHEEIGRAAAESGVDVLLGVGALARAYLRGANGVGETAWVETAAEAPAALQGLLRPGDCVLVKASRALGLETVAEALTGARGV